MFVAFSNGDTMVFEPTVCHNSGWQESFDGVQLWTMDHELSLIQQNREPPRVTFAECAGAERTIEVTPEDCAEFGGSMHETGRVIDGAPEVAGELNLDCTTQAGAVLRGEVSFERCSTVDRSGRP